MNLAHLDLAIRRGSRLTQPVLVTTNGQVVPLPAGTTARMQVRANPKSEILLAELTSNAGGGLLVDANNAKVTISMTSAMTATFDFERATFDLQLIYPPDSEKEFIVEGKVYVFPSVTRG